MRGPLNRIKVFIAGLPARTRQLSRLRSILTSGSGPPLELVEGCGPPGSGEEGRCLAREIAAAAPHIVFLVSEDSPESCRALIQSLCGLNFSEPIIVVSYPASPNDLLAFLQDGAADFIIPPLQRLDVLPRLWRWTRPQAEAEALMRLSREKLGLENLVGESACFLEETRKIPLISRCDTGVLISGESGTGKELVARAIHYLSPRSSKPFVPVSCGAIPRDLAESELFGHEAGAFTGAQRQRRGFVEEAQNGTILLDDVDCLDLSLQTKLLRFLQEKEYRRLGSSELCRADVRVVAATNCRLDEAVKSGTFRSDLFYRLKVVSLTLPPLRERAGDILPLANHFLQKYAHEFQVPAREISPLARQKLLLHDWPGNVRELEHLIEGAVVLSFGPTIEADHLALPSGTSRSPESFREAKQRIVDRFEQEYICRLLEAHQGNITRAAKAARKNRRALFALIRKHHINVSLFVPSPA